MQTLDDLRDALNDGSAHDLDMADLPTFGGRRVTSTEGFDLRCGAIWSWDADRVLAGDAAPFQIWSDAELLEDYGQTVEREGV